MVPDVCLHTQPNVGYVHITPTLINYHFAIKVTLSNLESPLKPEMTICRAHLPQQLYFVHKHA